MKIPSCVSAFYFGCWLSRTSIASTHFQTLGALLFAAYDWVNNVPLLLTWVLGALIYSAVFYQARLLPR